MTDEPTTATAEPTAAETLPATRASLTKTDRRTFLEKVVPPETMVALQEAHDHFFGALQSPDLTVPERTILSSTALVRLREALKGPILDAVIMPLMNTAIGFDTDKHPGKGGYDGPAYPKAVVLECACEAWLHGLPLIGNAWNIIASTMYPRKEGFEGLVAALAKYTIEVDVPPLPKELWDNGGYLKCPVRIQYRLHDDPEKDPADPEKEFPNRRFHGVYSVRVNRRNVVAVEASEGKAKRKALRDLYRVITGVLLPEAEDLGEAPAGIHQVGSAFGPTRTDEVVHELRTDGGKPQAEATEATGDGETSPADTPVAEGQPPWETISPDQVEALQAMLEKRGASEYELLESIGQGEIAQVKFLPIEDFDKARDAVDRLPKKKAKKDEPAQRSLA